MGNCLNVLRFIVRKAAKFFRDLERLALLSLQHYPMSIVAVGGGAVLEADNLQVLQCVGRLIYLLISKEGLRQRLYLQDQPAFFDASCFDEAFEKMYRLRLPLYEAIYAHKIDVEVGTEEQILNRLKEAVHGK